MIKIGNEKKDLPASLELPEEFYLATPPIAKLAEDAEQTSDDPFEFKLALTNSTPQSKVVLVSSFRAEDFYEWKGDNFKYSLFHHQPLPYPVWIYHENSWAEQHGGVVLKQEDVPHTGGRFIDIMQTPGLAGVSNDNIKNFYKYARSDSWGQSHWPTGNPKVMRFAEGMTLMRKVAAIRDALFNVKDDTLIMWLDLDVSINGRLSDEFLAFMAKKHTATLARWWKRNLDLSQCDFHMSNIENQPKCLGWSTETGIFAIRASPLTRRFIQGVLDLYDGGMLRLAKRCFFNENSNIGQRHSLSNIEGLLDGLPCEPWVTQKICLNDVPAFDLLLMAFEPATLQKGWLGGGCEGNGTAYVKRGFFCTGEHPEVAAPPLSGLHHAKNSPHSPMIKIGNEKKDLPASLGLPEEFYLATPPI